MSQIAQKSWRVGGAAIILLLTLHPATGVAAPAPVGQCDLEIRQQNETRVSNYDALDGGSFVEQIRLRLINRGDGPCVGQVIIGPQAGSPDLIDGAGGKLNYQIVAEDNPNAVLFDPVTRQSVGIPVALPGRREGNASLDIKPRLLVPGGQSGRSGHYVTALVAQFVTRPASATVPNLSLAVSADVVPSVQANFVGAGNGRRATLDLGELRPDLAASIGLQIRASYTVSVSVSSENKGQLAQWGGQGKKIPYKLDMAGQEVDLSQPDSVDIAMADSVRGQTSPVRVTIGRFNGAPPGDYSDTITIRISAP